MSVRSKLRGLREVLTFDNKLQLLVNLLFFRNTSLTVYRRGDLEFIVDAGSGDVNGIRRVLTSGMYKDFLQSPKCKVLWDSADSVLDLGANAGGFSLLLAELGISIKTLVCVEMNPHTFRRLEFNVTHNLNCDVTCLNAAVCGQKQTLSLTLGRGSTGDSIYAGSDSDNGGSTSRVLVQGLSLDDICEQSFIHGRGRIDLCKIDVEGAEYEIFSNPGHQWLERCHFLIMEIHNLKDAENTTALFEEIKRLGFIQIGRYEDVFLFENESANKDR